MAACSGMASILSVRPMASSPAGNSPRCQCPPPALHAAARTLPPGHRQERPTTSLPSFSCSNSGVVLSCISGGALQGAAFPACYPISTCGMLTVESLCNPRSGNSTQSRAGRRCKRLLIHPDRAYRSKRYRPGRQGRCGGARKGRRRGRGTSLWSWCHKAETAGPTGRLRR